MVFSSLKVRKVWWVSLCWVILLCIIITQWRSISFTEFCWLNASPRTCLDFVKDHQGWEYQEVSGMIMFPTQRWKSNLMVVNVRRNKSFYSQGSKRYRMFQDWGFILKYQSSCYFFTSLLFTPWPQLKCGVIVLQFSCPLKYRLIIVTDIPDLITQDILFTLIYSLIKYKHPYSTGIDFFHLKFIFLEFHSLFMEKMKHLNHCLLKA